ncbi:MAG: arsenite methyltransferase [Candidatus Krumholzibacteriia bacterium]
MATRRSQRRSGILAPAREADPAASLARVFKALGDPTRLRMLELLLEQPRPLCVCEIHARFGLAQPTVSHHLRLLREAGLVQAERRGTWVYYTAATDVIGMAGEELSRRAARAEHTSANLEETTVTKRPVREIVRERYAEAAQAVTRGDRGSCCGGGCSAPVPLEGADPITRDLYGDGELASLPEAARLASLGCGNPTALADLRPGEVVLDLGSGGGIDVLLSARRVGPAGKAYGVDMTDEMVALARANQERAGVTNAEFLTGTLEDLPLPDAAVDVIISNCVVNLAGDKDLVLREAFRVLRPGGRLAIADIVLQRELPPEAQASMALWTGCVAGALVADDYRRRLADAGFVGVAIELTRVYTGGDLAAMARAVPAAEGGPEVLGSQLDLLEGAVASAFIRARRPD